MTGERRGGNRRGCPTSSTAVGRACRPFGNPGHARVFVVGHDPRLQNSDAEAATVFFLDYLEKPKSSRRSEARKYELAKATVEYVEYLTGTQVPLEQMYFTNLCNEFLPHAPKGSTVLIPDEVADRGIKVIERAVGQGNPQVLIPMSLQVFYHLARSGFVTSPTTETEGFLRAAMPHAERAAEGAYSPVGRSPFLDVCGKLFYHRELPVAPVLHVKQWPLKARMRAYKPAMQAAAHTIQLCLGGPPAVPPSEAPPGL